MNRREISQPRLDIFGRPQDRRVGHLLGPRGRQILTAVTVFAVSLAFAVMSSDIGEGPAPSSTPAPIRSH